MISDALKEVREWKNKIYEEDKQLSSDQQIEKIKKVSDQLILQYNIKIKRTKPLDQVVS